MTLICGTDGDWDRVPSRCAVGMPPTYAQKLLEYRKTFAEVQTRHPKLDSMTFLASVCHYGEIPDAVAERTEPEEWYVAPAPTIALRESRVYGGAVEVAANGVRFAAVVDHSGLLVRSQWLPLAVLERIAAGEWSGLRPLPVEESV